jgi:hypothetical protein
MAYSKAVLGQEWYAMIDISQRRSWVLRRVSRSCWFGGFALRHSVKGHRFPCPFFGLPILFDLRSHPQKLSTVKPWWAALHWREGFSFFMGLGGPEI